MLRVKTIGLLSLAMALFLTTQASWADDYPCGSDSMPLALKKMIPQEFRGADFRPACRCHDSCYDTPGANKQACDRQFLNDLRSSCKNSKKPNRLQGTWPDALRFGTTGRQEGISESPIGR